MPWLSKDELEEHAKGEVVGCCIEVLIILCPVLDNICLRDVVVVEEEDGLQVGLVAVSAVDVAKLLNVVPTTVEGVVGDGECRGGWQQHGL